MYYSGKVAEWSFLTNHARAMLCIAHDPGVRMRDIAASLGITERRAHAIVNDLTEAGYVAKQKAGRRNHYQIRTHMHLPDSTARDRTVGDVLNLLVAGERSGDARGIRAPSPAGTEGKR